MKNNKKDLTVLAGIAVTAAGIGASTNVAHADTATAPASQTEETPAQKAHDEAVKAVADAQTKADQAGQAVTDAQVKADQASQKIDDAKKA